MAGIRMTGLASGMDTQSLISQLSEAYQKKVDNTKKAQTKAEWKKTVWAGLNTKLQNFYKGALSTFKSAGTYNAKAVTGSLSGVKVTAGNKAVNGTHTVQVTSTASAQMWTGKKINNGTVDATVYKAVETSDAGRTNLSSLVDSEGNSLLHSLDGAQFEVWNNDRNGGMPQTISLGNLPSRLNTVQDLTDYVNTKFSGTGISVSFDDGKLMFTNSNQSESTIKAVEGNSAAEAFGVSRAGFEIVGRDSNNGTAVSRAGSTFAYVEKTEQGSAINGNTKLSDMGITASSISVNGQTIAIDRNTTLSGLASAMAEKGINASYDEAQGRFYLSSKNTGTANAFTVDADDVTTLQKLGLKYDVVRMDGESDDEFAARKKAEGRIDASDASIIYNGVEYTNTTNNFNINGLTFDVTAKGEEMQFSVDSDVDGIYNKVKDFIKEYNSILTEMTTYYNADSSRGYDPLTSDEKEAMSDDEVKEWEKKIKDSLLRRDDNLGNMISNFRSNMNKSVIIDGKGYSLSSFGINTGDWSERGLLHLDGDPDDPISMGNVDKLKAAIAADPEAVTKTLSEIGSGLYDYMMKVQNSSSTRSYSNFYDDKSIDSEIKARKDDVSKMQAKMEAEEDKYYKQFSAMETAMAKLQSQQSYLAGLFGG